MTRRDASPGRGADAPTRRESAGGARRTRRLRLPEDVASRYEYVHDLAAAGGEADIALLRDRSTGVQVIFKSYRAGIAPDPVAMELLRAADPAHVVRLIELHDGPDGVWELQEYCPLGSLRDWVDVRGGRLDAATLEGVVREIAAALEYLHTFGSGVAHRDLKPANVLVRAEEPLDLVLTDFGLAKAHQALTHLTTTVKGTWHYAAPEVHARQSSAKSDWFSLGAMVYEFHTGRPLFAMADGAAVTEDDAKSRSIAGNYSTDLVDDSRWKLLVDGLLTWDKDHRWGAGQVEAWLRGESPAVHSARVTAKRSVGYRPAWSPTLVSTPEELAEQFRQHWDAAAAELAGRPDEKMRRFLKGFPGLEDAIEVITSGEAPGPKLVRLQGILDPAGPIHFEGTALEGSSLAERIRAASGGDEKALDWLRSVLDEHILTAYAEVTGSQTAAKADYRLTRWAAQADETIKPLPRDYQELGRQEFRAALPALFVRALGGDAFRSAHGAPRRDSGESGPGDSVSGESGSSGAASRSRRPALFGERRTPDVAQVQRERQVVGDRGAAAPRRTEGAKPVVGERYRGTVTSTAVFGAFVSHPSGKDGLLHISNLRVLNGGARVVRTEDVARVGQQFDVEVISVRANGDFGLALVDAERRGQG